MYETQIAPRGQKTPPPGNMPGVLAEPGPQVRDAATSFVAAGTPLSLWCRRCAATIASTVPQSPSSCRWRSRRRRKKKGMEAIFRRHGVTPVPEGSLTLFRKKKKRKKKLPKHRASSSRGSRWSSSTTQVYLLEGELPWRIFRRIRGLDDARSDNSFSTVQLSPLFSPLQALAGGTCSTFSRISSFQPMTSVLTAACSTMLVHGVLAVGYSTFLVYGASPCRWLRHSPGVPTGVLTATCESGLFMATLPLVTAHCEQVLMSTLSQRPGSKQFRPFQVVRQVSQLCADRSLTMASSPWMTALPAGRVLTATCDTKV